jgi:peptidoglycan/xylan/chitin deacetylase (PgdA/CDA1 family)
MYHYVRDTAATAFPALHALSVADFDRQLDALSATGEPISCDHLVRHFAERRGMTRPSILLTFDDGFVDHYETVFARLAARQWPGVFFLAGETLGDRPRVLNVHKIHFLIARLGTEAFAAAVRAWLTRLPEASRVMRSADVYRYDGADHASVKHLLNYELPFDTVDHLLGDLFAEHLGDESAFARTLYLSEPMIREMAAGGMTFGYHTARHRVLSRLDRNGQTCELAGGVALIRGLTGQTHVPFCYPYGHAHTLTAETEQLLDALGYACAFTTERRLARPDRDRRFAVPRYDTRDLPPFAPNVPDA